MALDIQTKYSIQSLNDKKVELCKNRLIKIGNEVKSLGNSERVYFNNTSESIEALSNLLGDTNNEFLAII